MRDKLSFRRASIAEADRLGKLAFAAWDSGMRQIVEAEIEAGMLAESAVLELSFQLFCINATSWITVAEHEGKVLGWSAQQPMSAYISDLWVAPHAQRRGVGGSLLSTIEQDIFRAGHDTSVLETLAQNDDAIRFYARQGYGVVWRGTKFSRFLGQRVEKVRMEKELVVSAH